MRDINWLEPGVRVHVPHYLRGLALCTGTVRAKHHRPFEWLVHWDDEDEVRIINAAKLHPLHPDHDPLNQPDEARDFFKRALKEQERRQAEAYICADCLYAGYGAWNCENCGGHNLSRSV